MPSARYTPPIQINGSPEAACDLMPLFKTVGRGGEIGGVERLGVNGWRQAPSVDGNGQSCRLYCDSQSAHWRQRVNLDS